MKHLAWVTLPLLIILLGCSPLQVNYDYDTATNFDSLKTFTWLPATGNAASDELLVKKIRNAIDNELQAKGRAEAPGNPDFMIAMQFSGKTIQGGSVGVGASVGIPVGRAGSINVGGGKSKPVEKLEGTLVLDFIDAKTQGLVWRATAVQAVRGKDDPEGQQRRVNEVIAEMLSQFPPKK